MATALAKGAKGKSKEASFRILFKNLEKSKINSRGQDEALMELSACFLAHLEKEKEVGYKQALANTVRWYENHRKYLDQEILGRGLGLLYDVFNMCGHSSLAETSSCRFEAIKILRKVEYLCKKNRCEEALSLLKTMEERHKGLYTCI